MSYITECIICDKPVTSESFMETKDKSLVCSEKCREKYDLNFPHKDFTALVFETGISEGRTFNKEQILKLMKEIFVAGFKEGQNREGGYSLKAIESLYDESFFSEIVSNYLK